MTGRTFFLVCLLCLLCGHPERTFALAEEASAAAQMGSVPGPAEPSKKQEESLPEPKAGAGESVIEIEADWVKSDEETQTTEASGQAVARYKTSTVSGDRMKVDQKSYIATVDGPFRLEEKENGKIQVITGENLRYNFKTRLALFKKGYIVQEAEGPGQHLYIEAGEALSKNRRRLLLKQAEITSCNFVEKKLSPHYHITASAGLVIPKDKVILRNMTLYYGTTPIFWSPIWFISLKKRQYLSIGNNTTEGWHLKTAFAYSLKGNDIIELYRDFQDIFNESLDSDKEESDLKLYPDDYGVVYNDFMEKKGWGKGFEHTHEFNGDTSLTGAYYQLRELDTGLDDYSFKVDLRQRVSRELRYTAIWEDRSIYNLGGGRDDRGKGAYSANYNTPTTAAAFSSSNDYYRGIFPGNTTTNMLNFSESFSPQWQLASSVNHSSSVFPFSFDQIMTHQTTLTYRENWGSVALMNRQFQDMTPNPAVRFANRVYTDISPELSVQYNLVKALDQPFSLKGSAGYYFEKTSHPVLPVIKGNRYTTDILAVNRPIALFNNPNLSLDLGGTGYTQYFYDSGDQQYVIHEKIGATFKAGPAVTLSSNFLQDHLNPENNRPFRTFDLLTGQHLTTESLRVSDQKSYDWTTSSGFNYLLDQYLPLLSSANYFPNQKERYNLSFGYDINTKIYHPLTLQANLQSRAGSIANPLGLDKMEPAWSTNHYFSYNLNLGRLESMTNGLTYDYGHRWEDHWIFSFSGSYSFFTQKYDFTQIAIVKDLHDIMISFSYSPLSQSYLLTLSSVAFPSSRGEVGLSQGQYSVGVPGQRFQF